MSFINETFNISLFLPDGVNTDFENKQCASDVKAVKWKKQQRFTIKFSWPREHRPRQIHQELLATPGSDAHSEDSVQYWRAGFQSGDAGCKDISRPDRPLIDLTEPFHLFLQNYPFASARTLS
jgi:hypothetical protein